MMKYADTERNIIRPDSRPEWSLRFFLRTFGLLLLLVVFSLPVTVDSKNVGAICGDCHLSSKKGKDGKSTAPVTQDLSHSVHNKFNCVECHEYHPEVAVVKGRKAHAPFNNVDCASCHVAKGRNSTKDPHSIAQKNGKLKSSACVTCHGYHNIQLSTTKEAPLNKNNIKTFCSGCHKGMQPPEQYHKEDRLSRKVCMSCHGDLHQDLENYHLNISILEKSIHHIQECVDCHSDIKDIPHDSDLKDADCIKCHERYRYKKNGKSYTEEYKASVHGKEKILKGNKKAPWCSDCHGAHNIHPASDENSTISQKNVVATCGNCHRLEDSNGRSKDKTSVEQYNSAVHKKIFKKNPDLAKAVCIECHGEHNIPSREEVPIIMDVNHRLDAVPFNHINHEAKIEPCSTCHHRQLKPCRDCHTLDGKKEGAGITAYQAYHWPDVTHSCVGCHEMEKKKQDCAVCHETMSKGAIESSCHICHSGADAYTNGNRLNQDPASLLPKGLPDVIDVTIIKKDLGSVKFPHKHVIEAMNKLLGDNSLANTFHAGRPVVCIACHHHSPLGEKPPACATCHREQTDKRNINKPGLTGALHRNCLGCHNQLRIDDYIYCGSCHKDRVPGNGKKK